MKRPSLDQLANESIAGDFVTCCGVPPEALIT
jgi:hypothetical protein